MKTWKPRDVSIEKSKHGLTSSWGIGRQTPAFIMLCYLSAVVVALAHLALFNFLDGRRADGPNEIAPQSYIQNASHLLASAFQVALQASLGGAFVQYLWFVLRRSALSVSTIETLFLIRSEPLRFFNIKLLVLKSTSILFLIASLIWATYIATIFPPGSLNIVQVPHDSNSSSPIPTFNASFMGNGSINDAIQHSLDVLWVFNGSLISGEPGLSNSRLQHLARNVLLNGISPTIPSPCGANCSYSTEFTGPYFICNSSVSNSTYNGASASSSGFTNSPTTGPIFTIYNGFWSPKVFPAEELLTTWPPPARPMPYFTFTSRSLMAISSTRWAQIVSTHNLICAPAKVQYLINNRYENSVQIMSKTSFAQGSVYPLYPFTAKRPLPFVNNRSDSLVLPSNFSTDFVEWYSNYNLVSLLNSVIMSLSGSYTTIEWTNLTVADTMIPHAGYENTLWSLNNTWIDSTTDRLRLLIADSKFNNYVNSATGSEEVFSNIKFTITPELLNDFLLNVTLSAITSYGYWNTTANVSVTTFINIYKFSSPLSLILPYFLSLAIALPFTILGLYALHSNGVPASDGGFIQLIMTTKSASLENEASVGCLGGERNIPSKLRDMKVKFGELIDKEGADEVVRRAGLGTEDEIVPLKKGARYGKPVRWI